MKIECKHTLGMDTALAKVRSALMQAMFEYSDKISDLNESWNYNVGKISFSCYGFTIKTEIVVEDSVVIVEGKIPWLISGYSGKIEQILLDNIKKILV